jgi:hypothetical protein
MKLIKFTQVVKSREEYPVYINPDTVTRVRPSHNDAPPSAKTHLVMGAHYIHLTESLEEVVAALTSPTLATRLAAKL